MIKRKKRRETDLWFNRFLKMGHFFAYFSPRQNLMDCNFKKIFDIKICQSKKKNGLYDHHVQDIGHD